MSFLSGIKDFASNALGMFKGDSLGASLLRTAASAYALNRIVNSINKENNELEDQGVELQLDPDPNNKIPVVYGTSAIGGNITDVVLASDNLSLWVCLTLCEQTGDLFSTEDLTDPLNPTYTASEITFDTVYMDGFEIVFKSDGITADYLQDVESNYDTRVEDLIQVYCYSNGSSNQVFPLNYSGTPVDATTIFPNWNSTKAMNNLVFALVKVTYNAEKRITNFPEFKFKLTNTMTQPGDCLYDYLTNTRYGAGIDVTEINAS